MQIQFDFSIARRPAYYLGLANLHQSRLSERGATLTRVSRAPKSRHLRLHAVCCEGHSFEIAAKHLELEQWCIECRAMAKNSTRQEALDALRHLARRRNHKLISASYINARTPLRWECHDGHRWSATADNYQNKGSGCPECHLIALFEARDKAHRRRKRWRRQQGGMLENSS